MPEAPHSALILSTSWLAVVPAEIDKLSNAEPARVMSRVMAPATVLVGVAKPVLEMLR